MFDVVGDANVSGRWNILVPAVLRGDLLRIGDKIIFCKGNDGKLYLHIVPEQEYRGNMSAFVNKKNGK